MTREAFVEESMKKVFDAAPSFTVKQLLTTLHTTPSLEKVAESDLCSLIEMVRGCTEKKISKSSTNVRYMQVRARVGLRSSVCKTLLMLSQERIQQNIQNPGILEIAF